MIINWFASDQLLCTTRGELPVAGSSLYLSNINNPGVTELYVVRKAYHTISITEVHRDLVHIPNDIKNPDEVFSFMVKCVEELGDGHFNGMTADNNFKVARQTGEVTLDKAGG